MAILISRRGLLGGIGAVLAAPAIVHAGNLMPIKAWPATELTELDHAIQAIQAYLDGLRRSQLHYDRLIQQAYDGFRHQMKLAIEAGP